jgi:hypothetical protein
MVSRRDVELDREVVTVPAGVLLAAIGRAGMITEC